MFIHLDLESACRRFVIVLMTCVCQHTCDQHGFMCELSTERFKGYASRISGAFQYGAYIVTWPELPLT